MKLLSVLFLLLQAFAIYGMVAEDRKKEPKFKIDHLTTFPGGAAFMGKFKKGTIESLNEEGTLRWADGRIFIGNFKDGKGTGPGVLMFPTGLLYIADFKEGNADGYGTVMFPDRRMYIGGLKENVGDGQGVLFFPNGKVVHGVWKSGNLTEEIPYETPKEKLEEGKKE